MRLRLVLAAGAALGPGKADLLAAVDETGSLTSAARLVGMSYRRAWLLVDELNHMFDAPLIETAKGGSGGGGHARLSPLGAEVLARFCNMERAAEAAVADDLAALRGRLKGRT